MTAQLWMVTSSTGQVRAHIWLPQTYTDHPAIAMTENGDGQDERWNDVVSSSPPTRHLGYNRSKGNTRVEPGPARGTRSGKLPTGAC